MPDLLHEFELGIWKAIFVHLIRILYAYGNDSISKLNSRFVSVLYWYIKFLFVFRFRRIAPFGRDTIRKFSNNASAMKKLAARDYEDLLQVRNHVCHKFCCSHLFYTSAQFQSLMIYCLQNTTRLSASFCSSWRLGMLLRSSGNTQKLRSPILRIREQGSARFFEYSKTNSVASILRRTCRRRRQLVDGARPQ